jgi:hypothetical protein
MVERGGPTTQSGILYQNSVAALYLGRLCDATQRPASDFLQKVRIEAPEHVDDIVVVFADEHKEYIQAKETIRVGDNAWQKLWKNFLDQYRRKEFHNGADQLVFQIGEKQPKLDTLQELCNRAVANANIEVYKARLTLEQKSLLEKIRAILPIDSFADADFLEFLSHIRVECWDLSHIEKDLVPLWIPESNFPKKVIFRLLRDRVGGKARRRDEFTSHQLRESLKSELPDLLFATPTEIESLREAIQSSSSQLRQHRCTIANTEYHLRRETVDKIISWINSEISLDKNVSILLDQAGMGKSVVLHDVLCELENQGVDVLAIKADRQLANITQVSDISVSLNLPQPIEQLVSQLARLGPVTVIVDQIDALSLSLAHNQRSLDAVLDLIGRLRCIPNVRIVLSCRIFDYNSDPRLRHITIGNKFTLKEFSNEEVQFVLSELNIEYDLLPEITRKLLSTPLHLDLLAMVLGTENSARTIPHSITSIQELYDLLWKNIIQKREPGAPFISDRIDFLYKLIKYMDQERKTSAPRSILYNGGNGNLEKTEAWLASNGIIIQNKTGWTFLHQTFFDYCFARHFVERGEDLVSVILKSPQGFHERPKLLYILSYMRVKQRTQFIITFRQLLDSNELRFHLFDHMLRWFGSIPNPSDDEWIIAQQMLLEKDKQPQILRYMVGNPAWFDLLYEDILPRWISQNSEFLDAQIIPYLRSMVEVEQEKIAILIRPYLNKGEKWIERVCSLLKGVRRWSSLEAVHLFEELTYRLPSLQQMYLHEISIVAKSYPEAGVRLLRHVLDRAVEDYEKKRSKALEEHGDTNTFDLSSISIRDIFNKLENSRLEEAFDVVSKSVPELFIGEILPWLELIINQQLAYNKDRYSYSWDDFCFGWNEGLYKIHNAIINSLISSLISLSKLHPCKFREIAIRLSKSRFRTPHQLLSRVYQSVPDKYAEDAFRYLLGDFRRLNLGDNAQVESRRLISGIFPLLKPDYQKELESFILEYLPLHKILGLRALKRRGIEQYRLLLSIPIDLLTPKGKKNLRQWHHKFQDFEISEKPIMSDMGFIGSPIPKVAVENMSDESWLRAFQKYRDGYEHKDFLKGGARELSTELQEEIKKNPLRFYNLLEKIPDGIDEQYITSYINGLAEAEAPAEWLFETIRRFAHREKYHIVHPVSWALNKRISDGFPEDLIKLLHGYVNCDIGEDELWWSKGENHGGAYDSYLNSDRGSAFETLIRYYEKNDDEISLNKRWKLLEYAAFDDSTALRIGAIHHLIFMIKHDRNRAITMFELLIEGHDVLLDSRHVREFIYWALYKNFMRLQPYILSMLKRDSENTQNQGAQLACIAAISKHVLESDEAVKQALALAEAIMTGPLPQRQGATRIYSHNLTRSPAKFCEKKLIKLLADKDDEIQREIGRAFHSMSSEHFFSLRSFIDAYARRTRILEYEFTEFMLEHGRLDSKWTLSVIAALLDNYLWPQGRDVWIFGIDDLIRLVLRIYSSPASNEEIQVLAVDLFDRLMQQFSSEAYRVLDEWDRR